jgi:hypothetical protein
MMSRIVAAIGMFALLSWTLAGAQLFAQARNVQTSPVSLVGRVLEEDGRPPHDLLQVDLVCSGRIRQQTLTATDGTFVFDLEPSRSEDWLDPGAGGSATGAIEGSARVAAPGRSPNLDEVPSMGRGRASLSGCEVRLAPRPGLVSNAINLRTRGTFENPDIGVIVVRRLSDATATTVSLSTLSAPKKAREAFDKANSELASRSPDLLRARRELEKAIGEYPEFSAAWDLLARVHLSGGDVDEGRRCFLRAVEEEPRYITPYLGLAQIGVQQGSWAEVATWTGKVLEIDSRHPQALYWSGLGGYYLSNFDHAEGVLSQLYGPDLGMAETYPFGLLLLGVVHANQGKIAAAAEELRLYLRLMPADQVSEPQRLELESQIASWEAEGLIPPPDERGSP